MHELKTKIEKNVISVSDNLYDLTPNNLLLEATNACNDKCIFCANRKMTRPRKMIDTNLAKRIIREGGLLGIKEIGFYATGEPLLNMQLEQLIKTSKDAGYEYSYITTNGSLLSEERMESLLDAGIDSIKFSINAASTADYKFIHGVDDFEKVLQNITDANKIRKKRNSEVKLFASCVMTRQTMESCRGLDSLIGNLVDEIVYQPAVNFSGCMNEIAPYLSLDGKGNYCPPNGICPYPFKHAVVSCEGYLTMCCLDYQNYLAIADLNNMPLKEGWKSKMAQDMRYRVLKKDVKGTICANCLRNIAENIEPLNEELCTRVDMKVWCNNEKQVVNRVKQWEENRKHI